MIRMNITTHLSQRRFGVLFCPQKNLFVLIGQINTLSAFRELGYKNLLAPYIDESYDEMDDSRRCFKAFDEAHKLMKNGTPQRIWSVF
jgi:hypothetical protein